MIAVYSDCRKYVAILDGFGNLVEEITLTTDEEVIDIIRRYPLIRFE